MGNEPMGMNRSVFHALRRIVGEANVGCSKEDRLCYSYDAATRSVLPDAVVFPENTGQVASILKLAADKGIAVVPRGAGTGMTGGSVAPHGGIVLAMNRFDRIIAVDADNMIAVVEPGVVTGRLHREVEAMGLFYPPDPSSSDYCTLGGNAAENAGGPRAVKYGVTRDYVIGLEAVSPSGDILQTGVRTAKGVVGYDLTRLLVGSEGTLAVITRITLKLLPLPQAVRTLTAVFDRMETAAAAVNRFFAGGIVPRTIEFMDQASLECVENRLRLGLPTDAEAILLIEVDGSENRVAEDGAIVERICRESGAHCVTAARTSAEASVLWTARKAISPALFYYGPDKINEDVVTPRSRIPDLVKGVAALRRETGLMIVAFGHAGDGNIHVNIMLNRKDPIQLGKANAAVERLFDMTLALGGTISGEHGVGMTKAPFLSKEIGPVEMNLMKAIKRLFDPQGILNPGKIFPEPHSIR